MNNTLELVSNFKASEVIIVLVMCFLVIKELVDGFQWVKGKLDLWRQNENQIESKAQTVQERLLKLEQYQENDYKILHELCEELKHIKQALEEQKKNTNKVTVASFRSTLYRIHKESVEQQYVTADSLKVFKEIGKIYEEAGGDDIYHEKLEPEMMSLPIKDI